MNTTETPPCKGVKETYFVEVTDTFGGEANYGWVKRFKVSASSMRGAVGKVSKECGYSGRCEKSSTVPISPDTTYQMPASVSSQVPGQTIPSLPRNCDDPLYIRACNNWFNTP